jgi:transcriptional regulator with XRE-family HTH domain
MPSRKAPSGRSALPLAAALRKKLGLPRRTFSRLTGFSERALAKWEGGSEMSEPSLRRLREIERLRDRLAEVVNPKVIPEWLETPNPAFGGLKPLEVVERGEVD